MGLPAPSYQDDLCTLYQGDALQLMPELPSASVQLIICDPPYFKQKLDYLGKRLDWDRQWPTRADYLAWLRQMAQEWRRVLAPNGSLYCFAAPQMAAHVEVLLEDYFSVIQRITWQKPPFATKAEMFRKEDLHSFFPVTEAILFCEQQGFLFEPIRAYLDNELRTSGVSIATIREALGFSGNMPFHWFARGLSRGQKSEWEFPTAEHYAVLQEVVPNHFIRRYEALRADYEALRRPFTVSPTVPYTDVWTFATVPYQPGKHPAEKPLALLRHIIEVSSRPGDLVLDCCAGSGTTLEAARQCGRQSIGIELEASSITLARQRLCQQSLVWE